MRCTAVRKAGATVALVLLTVLTGCSGDIVSTPEIPTPPPPLPSLPPSPSHTCPVAEVPAYQPVTYNGLSDGDLAVYSEVLVCSNGETRTIQNVSEGVWVVGAAAAGTPELIISDTASAFFRSIEPISADMLAKGLAVMAPGDVYKVHDANTISWAPHHSLSAAWGVQDLVMSEAMSFGTEYAGKTFSRQTGHSTSAIDCVWATYQATEAAGQLDTTSDTVDFAQAGLKTAGTGICLDATQKADLAARDAHARARAAGEVVQELPPIPASWQQRVSNFAGQADLGIDVWKIIDNAFRGCAYLPRIC